MPTTTAAATSPSKFLGILRRVVQMLILQGIFLACLLIAAGDPWWQRAWIYIGVSFALLIANFAYVAPRNPEVIV